MSQNRAISSLPQLQTEEECLALVEQLRWADGFRCPGCGNTKAWKTKRGSYRCSGCQRQTSILAGTAMAGTRLPLQVWFSVMRYMAKHGTGISAITLWDQLAWEAGHRTETEPMGTYKTAWTLLHKLREVMKPSAKDRLKGSIEIGYGDVEAVQLGLSGREGKRAVRVFVAIEREPGSLNRIFIRQISPRSLDDVLVYLKNCVEPESKTDIWSADEDWSVLLAEAGYQQSPAISQGIGMGVNSVVADLTRWLGNTYKGEMSEKHLDAYLDEFAFHTNHRRVKSTPEEVFQDLIQRTIQAKPFTFEQMVERGSD